MYRVTRGQAAEGRLDDLLGLVRDLSRHVLWVLTAKLETRALLHLPDALAPHALGLVLGLLGRSLDLAPRLARLSKQRLALRLDGRRVARLHVQVVRRQVVRRLGQEVVQRADEEDRRGQETDGEGAWV